MRTVENLQQLSGEKVAFESLKLLVCCNFWEQMQTEIYSNGLQKVLLKLLSTNDLQGRVCILGGNVRIFITLIEVYFHVHRILLQIV